MEWNRDLSMLFLWREVDIVILVFFLIYGVWFQSATERNFQYITAKLCNMLSKEQSIEPAKGEKFRSVFVNR